ncbi:Thioesterase/thiol ester dehydrase-isomerase [Cylindrobasidium torrendii FP15055 ss-10]|uniref:Thioesterase/thiol ester dehydrase-isomerase n=1 Tax=Cylindrobasidium torrendii FP15055 ss-10 TaxID=1314674 RepID=A0A0D7B8E4_9AGAR|nr:Thioesterase/thiol ester dehydrase-isomerase [Cylindrobasidium torrendii FP15055 ss-10]
MTILSRQISALGCRLVRPSSQAVAAFSSSSRHLTVVGPEEALNHQSALAHAEKRLEISGFNRSHFWEQPIAWGDHDSFQHVNNVRYVRFFESSRIHWMRYLGHRLGGPDAADALLKGKGVSLILKSIQVKFRRPVTFPDTLLLAHRPVQADVADDPAVLRLSAAAYSLKQGKLVAESNEEVVWYDYDRLRKCTPEDSHLDAVWGRGAR